MGKFARYGERNELYFVVEDEFDIQELLKNYLEEAGYQVFCASDGWKLLICTRRKREIDLVLLDVMLPKSMALGVGVDSEIFVGAGDHAHRPG